MLKDLISIVQEDAEAIFRLPRSVSEFFWRLISGFAYLFVILGPWFFSTGLSNWLGERDFLANSQAVNVEVVRIDSMPDRDGRTIFRPVFELDRADGSRHSHASGAWASPSLHKAGEVVPGRFSTASGRISSDATIASAKRSALNFMAIGGVAAIAGLLIFWSRIKKRASASPA